MMAHAKLDFSVYLDANKEEGGRCGAYVFRDPSAVILAETVSEIDAALDAVDQHLAEGRYVAGWISYEAGLYLEKKLQPLCKATYPAPFLCFGVFEARQFLTAAESDVYWAAQAAAGTYDISHNRLNISRSAYEDAVGRIKSYLAAGDIYQVNYTLKSQFDFEGSAASYYAALRRAQKVEYGAFITMEDYSILSLSPELFFDKRGEQVTTRPMKGTCGRGRTVAEDRVYADAMQQDDKSRAENLMIVDLLRNDLSRIALPGSVKVNSLYDVEKYRTLFQMTSHIEAKVGPDMTPVAILKALFPCGSVTGAPKIRAMEIIDELEVAPRGIYTGAIGYMAPEGDCCFSVPIRTMTIDGEGRGEMGIGSAIVADSQVAAEYDECLLKANFASRRFAPFDLIETLGWDAAEGFLYLDRHLDRLRQSAAYFDFIYPEAIGEDLMTHAACLDPAQKWKVRLLLSSKGAFSLTSSPLPPPDRKTKPCVTLSGRPVDSANAMLFHKTTDRAFYDVERDRHVQAHGSYDVLFINEAGRLTEASYHSVFVQRGGVYYTPPCEDGVLPGVLRQAMFDDPTVDIRACSLTIDDLEQADAIYLGNSVRGLVEVAFRPLP